MSKATDIEVSNPIVEVGDKQVIDVYHSLNVIEVSEGSKFDICSSNTQTIDLFDSYITKEGNPTNPFINQDIPNALYGLMAVEGAVSIQLVWIPSVDKNHAYTEIYRADIDDIAAAKLIGSSKSHTYMDVVCPTRQHYYWIRSVSYAGKKSDWQSVNGLAAKGGKDKDCFEEWLKNAIGHQQFMDQFGEINQLLINLGIEVGEAKAAIILEATTRLNQYESFSELVLSVIANLNNDIQAQFQEAITARSTWEEAYVQQLIQLEASFNSGLSDANAAINLERITRTSAIESVASQVTNLQTNFNTLQSSASAAIFEEQTARTTATESLAQAISELSASFDTKDSETRGMITQESTVRATEYGALASNINTLSTTVNGQTVILNQYAESLDGLSGKWGVQIDNNGRVTGVELLSGSDSYSSFTITADNFRLEDSNGNPMITSTGGIAYTAVTGGPPANATSNRLFRQLNQPVGANGDIWVQTTTPTKTWIFEGGAWREAASLVTNTNQISDGAGLGSTAVWTSVTGAGKPADNATVNRITTSTGIPTNFTGVNGDIHIRVRSGFPNEEYIRINGVWELAATLNEKITSGNIGTYISNLAVDTLYIGNNAVSVTDTNLQNNIITLTGSYNPCIDISLSNSSSSTMEITIIATLRVGTSTAAVGYEPFIRTQHRLIQSGNINNTMSTPDWNSWGTKFAIASANSGITSGDFVVLVSKSTIAANCKRMFAVESYVFAGAGNISMRAIQVIGLKR